MTMRRLLILLIIGLSALIIVGGGLIGGMAYMLLRRPDNQLLIVGDDQRLRLISAGGSERLLADDASSDLFRYPAPAPDGRFLAYISQDAQGFGLFRLHISSGERKELYRSRENPPLYMTWSPDGRYISFLSNLRGGGLGMHVVRADGSRPSELIGTTAGSSYFAWHPDGSSLLLHTGANQFQEGRIANFRPGSAEPQALLNDPGLFQAPAWSTSGREFFYVAQPPVEGQLTLDGVESVLTGVELEGGGRRILVSEQRAAIFFGRSPVSDQIAYITVSPAGYGMLKVIAPDASEVRTLSRTEEQVAAFFWSPDGRQIAYLSISPPQNGQPPSYTWHVVNLAAGSVQDFVSFTPSAAFAGMLAYFDAYAISLRLWSLNSSQLVYGAEDGVYILDLASGEARRAADGVLGMWVGQTN